MPPTARMTFFSDDVRIAVAPGRSVAWVGTLAPRSSPLPDAMSGHAACWHACRPDRHTTLHKRNIEGGCFASIGDASAMPYPGRVGKDELGRQTSVLQGFSAVRLCSQQQSGRPLSMTAKARFCPQNANVRPRPEVLLLLRERVVVRRAEAVDCLHDGIRQGLGKQVHGTQLATKAPHRHPRRLAGKIALVQRLQYGQSSHKTGPRNS